MSLKWRKVIGDKDLTAALSMAMKHYAEFADVPISSKTCQRKMLELYRTCPYFRVLTQGSEVLGFVAISSQSPFDYSDVRVLIPIYYLVNLELSPYKKAKSLIMLLEDLEAYAERHKYNVILFSTIMPWYKSMHRILEANGFRKPKMFLGGNLIKYVQ